MITIKRFNYGFEVTGHAEYAQSGKDIVCAAISALAHTGAFALKEIGGGIWLKSNNKITAFGKPDHTCKIILDTIFIGFNNIAKQYPDNVQIKEV